MLMENVRFGLVECDIIKDKCSARSLIKFYKRRNRSLRKIKNYTQKN